MADAVASGATEEGMERRVSFSSEVDTRPVSAREGREDDEETEPHDGEDSGDKLTPKQIGAKGRSAKSMYLLRSLASSLGFVNLYTPPEKHLDTVDVAGVVNYIKSGKCKNIICMCGAGISTSSGIPDYRSPQTGMLDLIKKEDLQQYGLTEAKDVFTYEFFKNNPEPYYKFACQRFPSTKFAKPAVSHYFIRLLDEKNLLLRNFTQNIDNLERLAGQSPERFVQVHGNYHACYCQKCYEEYTWDWCKEVALKEKVPKCTQRGCDGVVRPDIVMFGEALPFPFFDLASQDCPRCDLLIILGTSLAVAPFNRLCSNVPEETPRLMINREKAGEGDPFFALMGFGCGLQFDAKDNYRDVLMQGACDEGCYTLADGLGWGDELRELVKTEHARLDHLRRKKLSGMQISADLAAKETGGESSSSKNTPVHRNSISGRKETSSATSLNDRGDGPKGKSPPKTNTSTKGSKAGVSSARTGGGYKPSPKTPTPRLQPKK